MSNLIRLREIGRAEGDVGRRRGKFGAATAAMVEAVVAMAAAEAMAATAAEAMAATAAEAMAEAMTGSMAEAVAAAAVAARGSQRARGKGGGRIFKRAKYDADAECEALQSCRAWICNACVSSGLCNEAAITPNCKNMQSAGNLTCCAKVNIRQNSALLDPRMREYTPPAGSEQRCDSDYARLDTVPSPCRRYLLP